MKKFVIRIVAGMLCFWSALAPGQQVVPGSTVGAEMKRTDPRTVQAIKNAIQRGDLREAENILQHSQQPSSADAVPPAAPRSAAEASAKPSIFEQTMSGGLAQFGYDLFRGAVTTFLPAESIPVGPDYVIGPGDSFTLTLWGTTEGIYQLTVTKEGEVTLPKVGVVSVAGIRFGELERTLKRHLSKYYTNFNLSIAMGGLKTITVYVVGEVTNPGSYSLSSLSTVYGALYAGGGPTKLGTLRRVQVLRAGKVIKSIDLYDFLLRGDRSQDVRLQSEDTVFVPLIGPVAGVAGKVYRPAIYELKGKETIGDVIQVAGGVLPTALGGRLQLTRYADNKQKVILDVLLQKSGSDALPSTESLGEPVENMDVVDIKALYDQVWQTITLVGDVAYPGEFEWKPGMRVSDAIRQGSLLPTADMHRAEIVRMSEDFRDRVILPFDVDAVLKGDPAQDPVLRPKDQIRIYSLYRKTEIVTFSGEVMRPGTFEIKRGERLSDILRRAGGFTPQAYPYGAVFRRPDIKNAQARQFNAYMLAMQERLLQQTATNQAAALTAEESGMNRSQHLVTQQLLDNLRAQQALVEDRLALDISLDVASWAGTKDDPLLKDGDAFYVPQELHEVSIVGEVYNPGAFVYLADQSVSDYVAVAGGYTDFAKQKDVYVLKANGFAVSRESVPSGSIEEMELRPGDAVLVPQDLERHAVMRNTKDIVDILFKTAVVIATITILF